MTDTTRRGFTEVADVAVAAGAFLVREGCSAGLRWLSSLWEDGSDGSVAVLLRLRPCAGPTGDPARLIERRMGDDGRSDGVMDCEGN